MSTKRRTVPASRARASLLPIDRRTFLGTAALVCCWPRGLLAEEGEGNGGVALPRATVEALRESEFVYVSPLRADGAESTCHAEVWYGWLDGAVVLVTARTTWKARSMASGRDRARIWVGSYGRWKRPLGRNEEFLKGPRFDARGRFSSDPQLLERLLEIYDEKYPDGIERWRDRFRTGLASGERVLILYEPIAT